MTNSRTQAVANVAFKINLSAAGIALVLSAVDFFMMGYMTGHGEFCGDCGAAPSLAVSVVQIAVIWCVFFFFLSGLYLLPAVLSRNSVIGGVLLLPVNILAIVGNVLSVYFEIHFGGFTLTGMDEFVLPMMMTYVPVVLAFFVAVLLADLRQILFPAESSGDMPVPLE